MDTLRVDPWQTLTMSHVHASRSGLARHGLLPAGGLIHLRVLAVVGLIVGVLTMHSFGLGHGPMTVGHSLSAGTAQMTGMGAHLAPHTTTSVMAEAVVGVDPAHGMAAMCLAVLPFLLLLLARTLSFRIRGLAPTARLLPARRIVPSDRAPPAYRRLSLLKLCILRT